MPNKADAEIKVKAIRKGHYQVIREEGDVFMFTSASGNTKAVVEKSTWMEPSKEPAPAKEDPESE